MKFLPRCLAPFLFAFLLSATSAIATDWKLSRDNFFREVLYAKATSVTPLYNDYTVGSYHANKTGVLEGLPEVAKKEGLELRGLIVVGPVGPLWAYHIVAFIEEGNVIRVNRLTMPHARITYKSTGTISPKLYNDVLVELLQTKIFETEPSKGMCDNCPYFEYHYQVLVSDLSKRPPSVYYGRLDRPAAHGEVESFAKQLNSVFYILKQTYPLKDESGLH